jgi:hypothetical protein
MAIEVSSFFQHLVEALVVAAFVLESVDSGTADLTGRVHVGASAGLGVQTSDLHDPHLSSSIGGRTLRVGIRSGRASNSASVTVEAEIGRSATAARVEHGVRAQPPTVVDVDDAGVARCQI